MSSTYDQGEVDQGEVDQNNSHQEAAPQAVMDCRRRQQFNAGRPGEQKK